MKKVKEGDKVFVYDIIQTVDGPESVVYGKPVIVKWFADDGSFIMVDLFDFRILKWYETLQEASGAAHKELSELVTEKKKLF